MTVVALLSAGCVTLCNHRACEAASRPATNVGISRGIAGVATNAGDAIDSFGCGYCDFGRADLRVWRTADLVADAEAALRIVQTTAPDLKIDIDEHYEQSLEPGDVLVCDSSDWTCTALSIGEDTVYTVNVVHALGGWMVVFAPGEKEPSTADNFELWRVPGSNLAPFGTRPPSAIAPSPAQPTAYPPPLQTSKSADATEGAAREAARATAAAVGRDEPVGPGDMVHYSNPVLGLSFDYPRELGEVRFGVWLGETGEAWGLGFSRFDALTLAGVSPDFSQGRGGMEEDTYGYARDDGETRWLTIPSSPSGMEVEVLEVITSESGVESVVFRPPPLMGSTDDATPGPPASLINLAGTHFPGLIVLSRDPARLPADTLRAILRTIQVEPPSK